MNTPSALTAKARRFNAGFVMLGLMMMMVLQSVRAGIPDRNPAWDGDSDGLGCMRGIGVAVAFYVVLTLLGAWLNAAMR